MPKAGKKGKPRPKPTVVRAPVAVTTPTGGSKTVMKNYTRNKLQDVMNREMKARMASLTPDEAKKFTQLREMCDEGPGCSENEDVITYDDVAQGNVRVEISHAGGEMEALAADLNTTVNGERTSHATRSRRDAVQREVLGFRVQMKAMTDAYIKWGASQGEFGLDGDHTPPAPNEIEGTYKIEVVDIFSTYTMEVPMTGNDVYLSSCFVAQGLIPATPWKPKVAFTTHCLEIYRLVVDDRIKKVLGRDAPDWRLKNCCPACTYKLEGEMKIIFEMLRILVKDKTVDENGVAHGRGKERDDPRTADAGRNYLMTREDVDKWSKEVLATLVQRPRSKDKAEDTECQERWKNMSEELTAKMWGIFDETGGFPGILPPPFRPARRRHGQEQRILLQAFGPDLGVGYDIGCGFSSTVRDSPLGPLAEAMNLKMLVGAFHGHAHNRSCQLKHLATYFLGLGLEDLEMCERFFSKSNGLARAVRYAIVTYLAHMDTFETYANLSTFLVNNYKQALEQIDLEDSLKFAMDQAGISGPEVFEERLKQEQENQKQRLTKWSTIQGLFILRPGKSSTFLITCSFHRIHHSTCPSTPSFHYIHPPHPPTASTTSEKDMTQFIRKDPQPMGLHAGTPKRITTGQCRQCRRWRRRWIILVRWTVDDEEYENAEALVASRHYRLALNKLEELVIKRLFELTKMNMSGTGYKLRKHIAKALQTRSKTIRTALGRYNAAATSLDPPRRTLKWEEVVEFTFLSDFDLLRDPEGNAAIRPWATPAARALMDTHFKILRAKEEIQRLNIEIRRLVTYIRDERDFLVAKEEEIRETDPNLAFFVHRYCIERGRFDDTHMKRLRKLQATYKERFTGTLEPGVRRKEPEIPTPMVVDDQQAQREALEAEMHRVLAGGGGEDNGWETDDGDEEEEEEELARAIETVVVLATDKDETD
ncbi:hypothetical protein B0H14DRAFT_2587506 [Mycena olivaceomarginata]|nr:hypothetical protein B0H14DRAFT_2587506 [Mycena olivaceomarginata]